MKCYIWSKISLTVIGSDFWICGLHFLVHAYCIIKFVINFFGLVKQTVRCHTCSESVRLLIERVILVPGIVFFFLCVHECSFHVYIHMCASLHIHSQCIFFAKSKLMSCSLRLSHVMFPDVPFASASQRTEVFMTVLIVD